MKKLLIVLLLVVSGCARTVYVDRPVEVKVEVYKPCLEQKDIPKEPIYALSLLQSTSTDGEVILALRREVEERKNVISVLLGLLDYCTKGAI
jgi:hypothetical protein